jgi:hypothetical protein
MRGALAFLLVTAGLGFSAAAQEAGDRYAMTPAKEGFLRLDKQTGAVSFCTVENGLASCRLGADERAALEGEIERLRRENAELNAAAKGVPSDDQFERALTLTERFFRRFLRLFKDESLDEKS